MFAQAQKGRRGKEPQENYSVRKPSSFLRRQLKGKHTRFVLPDKKKTTELGVLNNHRFIFVLNFERREIDSSKELVVWKFWNLLSPILPPFRTSEKFCGICFKKKSWYWDLRLCAKRFCGALGLFSKCDFLEFLF